MTERKEGWYWVKVDGYSGSNPGYWNPEKRLFGVCGLHVEEDDAKVLGHRIPGPDEPWQCVPLEPTEEMHKAGDYARSHDCFSTGIYADMLAAAPRP